MEKSYWDDQRNGETYARETERSWMFKPLKQRMLLLLLQDEGKE